MRTTNQRIGALAEAIQAMTCLLRVDGNADVAMKLSGIYCDMRDLQYEIFREDNDLP